MDPQATIPGFSFPLSGGLFQVAVRGLGLGPDLRVLDLYSGQGAAALRLARDPGCSVTAVESDPTLCRRAREYARAAGMEDRVVVRQMDPHRLELPARNFDAVMALGAAPTALGRAALLERCHFYLRPGGHLLLADLVYLDSPASGPARQLLTEIRSDVPLEPQGNAPAPAVRGLLEQGRYRFETESDYRQLLEAMGYAVEFSFLSPESEWGEYFERMSREYGDRHAHEGDVDARARLSEEAAAYYALGGRASVGYLVVGARCLEYED
ncbi:MAG: class I SAM-dependent methyltransferase [Candidatus Eisenbacteria bacterium]